MDQKEALLKAILTSVGATMSWLLELSGEKESTIISSCSIQEAGTSHRTGVQLGPCVDIQCLGTSNSRLKGYSSAKWIPTVAVSRPSFTSTFISIFLNMPPLRNLSAND